MQMFGAGGFDVCIEGEGSAAAKAAIWPPFECLSRHFSDDATDCGTHHASTGGSEVRDLDGFGVQ
jgi:hypothetical protein